MVGDESWSGSGRRLTWDEGVDRKERNSGQTDSHSPPDAREEPADAGTSYPPVNQTNKPDNSVLRSQCYISFRMATSQRFISVFLPDAVACDNRVERGILLGRSEEQGGITYAAVSAFLPLRGSHQLLLPSHLKKLEDSGLHAVGTLASRSDDLLVAGQWEDSGMLFRLLKLDGQVVCCPSSEDDDTLHRIVNFSPSDLLSSELLLDHSPPNSFTRLVLRSFNSNLSSDDEKNVILFHRPTSVTPCEHTDPQTDDRNDSFGWKAVCLTTTGALLRFRFQQLKYLYANTRRGSRISLKVGNVLSAILIDVIIGILFTNFLLRNPDPASWLTVSVSFAENVISRLESLLHTLMEMPAGLKLNRPLNSTLGQFFLYHIYLLRTYVSIMKPVYMAIAGVVSLFGMCGLTCILSIMCDLFSLATVHIFCFYGYAARLYSFQTYSLSALWRLFRGKKWNQLKSRVDSYSYQYDQLFIGSISFTIVVFLLPTVLLYYSVFLTLRLATMAFLLVIRLLIWRLSILPAFACFHAITSSKKLVTGVYFAEKNSRMSMRTTNVTWAQLFQTNPLHLKNPLAIPQNLHVSGILSKIVWGDLLSPF